VKFVRLFEENAVSYAAFSVDFASILPEKQ